MKFMQRACFLISSRSARAFSAALFVVLFSIGVIGQETRGTIVGSVTDSTGAAVANASVKITNIATNVSTDTTTNGDGNFTVPFLNAGTYRVAFEAPNFKKLVQENVQLQVAARLELNVQLEAGNIAEIVTVEADNTALETATASVGQVVDRRRISELPLADGNPFFLSRLAGGVAPTVLGPDAGRPFSNSEPSSVTTNGAPNGNEYTLDGAPNTADRRPGIGNRVSFAPSTDSVQEFKVTTSSFDAQQGRTAGATIDVAIRSGGNRYSGTLYEFVRNDAFTTNDFFTNRSAALGRYSDGTARRSVRRYNRYGGTIGGPLPFLNFGEGGPLFTSGKDRTFFFAAYEGIRDIQPRPVVTTVPTAAQRNGDFSALLAAGVIIYDPLSARCVNTSGAVVPPTTSGGQITGCPSGSRPTRLPFAGNIIPSNRINPVARNLLQFLPLPNAPGDAFGRGNFVGQAATRNEYYSIIGRIDHTINDRNKVFVRYAHTDRAEDDENFTGVVNGLRATGFIQDRINDNVAADYVGSFTPNFIFNFRFGFARFDNVEASSSNGFDPASLGFAPQTAGLFFGNIGLPRFDIPCIADVFTNIGGRTPETVLNRVYSFQPTVTNIWGNHSIRYGADYRQYLENSTPPFDANGRYRFNADFTRLNDLSSTTAPFGQELAAFMLGAIRNNTVIQRNTDRRNKSVYNGVFVQDDWRVTQKLTLNLGLRYEYEQPPRDEFNRNIRFFDMTTPNPIEAGARAAYATNYAANPANFPITPENFRVRGGPVFADEQNPQFFNGDKDNFQPRIGFAYQITPRSVVRGGYAIYHAPIGIESLNATGFSFDTIAVPTTNNGLTFVADLTNPFPTGIVEPFGNSRGLATGIGATLGGAVNLVANTIDRRVNPLNLGERKNPRIQRFTVSFQQEIFGNFVVEAAYIGSRGNDLTTVRDINPIPRQFLSNSPANDAAAQTFLQTNVANPFRNLPQAQGTPFFTSSNVQRQQLLRPFPQFQSVFVYEDDGRNWYDSMQLRLERRFAQGFSFLATYTYSRLEEAITRLNPTDEEYERRIGDADIPHRFTASGIFELPFGKGRRFFSNAGGLTEILLGGFQLTGIYQYQTGLPLTVPPVDLRDGVTDIETNVNSQTIDTGVFDRSVFLPDRAALRNGLAIRTAPSRFKSFRGDNFSNLDLALMKNISFTETVRLQLRAEMLNAFNKPLFTGISLNTQTPATLGTVLTGNNQVNLPREFQFGIKLLF
jgi:hypothetical protein